MIRIPSREAVRVLLVLVIGGVLQLAATDAAAVDEQYKRQLAQARRALLRGSAEQAAGIYEQLREKKPNELQAAVGYAEALIVLERLDEVDAVIDSAMAHTDNQADLYRMRVKLRRSQKRPGEAFDALLPILQEDGERAQWIFHQTRLLLEEELDPSRAERRIASEREAHPKDLDLMVLTALVPALDGRAEAGLAAITAIEEEQGIPGRAILRYAETLQSMEFPDQALAAYQVAARRTEHPAHRSRILFALAGLQEHRGDYRDALASLDTIAAERAGHTAAGRALLKSADIYQRYLDDPQGALEVYSRIRNDPILGHHQPDMLLQMADCYVRLDRLEEAERTYHEVLPEALDPEQAETASFKAAEVVFYRGEPDSAMVLYQDMAENNPRSLLADDAAHRYITLVKNTRVPGVLELFGRMEWGRYVGDSTAVDTSAALILELEPQGEIAAEAWIALAELSVRASRPDEALARLERVVEDHAWDKRRAPQALMRMGALLEHDLDRPQDALLRYETILTDYPQSVLTGDARRIVERLRRDLKS
jgi:tetratricopeptide (TPR) repeat protein